MSVIFLATAITIACERWPVGLGLVQVLPHPVDNTTEGILDHRQSLRRHPLSTRASAWRRDEAAVLCCHRLHCLARIALRRVVPRLESCPLDAAQPHSELTQLLWELRREVVHLTCPARSQAKVRGQK